MKYIVIKENAKELMIDYIYFESNDLEDAIEMAESHWNHLTRKEKEKYNIYVLESENPDLDAENHFDGEVVRLFA